jgi:hypothetical protein
VNDRGSVGILGAVLLLLVVVFILFVAGVSCQ